MLPEVIVEKIVDEIFESEVNQRPELVGADYETVETIVRLAIHRLEKMDLFDGAKIDMLLEKWKL